MATKVSNLKGPIGLPGKGAANFTGAHTPLSVDHTNLIPTTGWLDGSRWTSYSNNANLVAISAGDIYQGRTAVKVTSKTGDWMGGTGTFETATVFTAQGSATLTRDTSRYHSGTRSLKVQTGTASADPDASYTWSCRIGQKITYSAWIYRPSGNINAHAAIALGPSTLVDNVVESSQVTADGWQQVTVTANVIGQGNGYAYLIGSDVAGESVWFDDVSLMVSGTASLGVRTNVASVNLNLQAGHTYWVAADIYVGSLNKTGGIRLIARDDPNNDSLAATPSGPTTDPNLSLPIPGRDQWFRTFWQATVNAGRTITGIYFVTTTPQAADLTYTTVHPDGSVVQVDRVLVTEVQAGETQPPDFFDGDTLDTPTQAFDWTGTAHQSTSTRSSAPPGTLSAKWWLSPHRVRDDASNPLPLTAGKINLVPVRLFPPYDRNLSVDGLACSVVTPGSSDATVLLGLFPSNIDGQPVLGGLLGSGTVQADTAGDKIASFTGPVTLTPGLYFLAALPLGTTPPAVKSADMSYGPWSASQWQDINQLVTTRGLAYVGPPSSAAQTALSPNSGVIGIDTTSDAPAIFLRAAMIA